MPVVYMVKDLNMLMANEGSSAIPADTRIYLDNAATTPLDPIVFEAMMPYFSEKFGNPSSIYSYGRESRLGVESARKSVAKLLHAHPSEIFFTSGGTEASNTAILGSVHDLGCKQIITSAVEHHATLHMVQHLQQIGQATVSYVKLQANGHIDLTDLESQLKVATNKTLVTLMHANNEIGTMIDLHTVGNLCRKYGAIFHSDTVQTVGHFAFDLQNTAVDFITGAAHKFNGPKGIGMLFINRTVRISPFIHGGSQERNMRAGTENVYGIVGFAKALELATAALTINSNYINGLRVYMMDELQKHLSSVTFNGDPGGSSLYTVLSVNFPKTEKSEMLLYNLDINRICVSGGSACTSGADAGSHVIKALDRKADYVTVRFSFGKQNTKAEIDIVVDKLLSMI